MRSNLFLLSCCCGILGIVVTPAYACGSSNKDKVLLKEVTALTLEQGKMTTGRRFPSLPQLKCIGGSTGCSYANQPRVVECINTGFDVDGYDVQWECKVLDSNDRNIYRLGWFEVSCEGYDYDQDPYVLRGSCGLRYEWHFTQHQEKYTVVTPVSPITLVTPVPTATPTTPTTTDINNNTWWTWVKSRYTPASTIIATFCGGALLHHFQKRCYNALVAAIVAFCKPICGCFMACIKPIWRGLVDGFEAFFRSLSQHEDDSS